MDELSEHIISAPVVLLTGAGASVPLGKPTTAQFVERVNDNLGGEHGRVWMKLVQSCRVLAGADVVDVEVILEHVRHVLDLANTAFQDQNLAPLVDGARPIFERYADIERRLCELVVAEYADVDHSRACQLYGPLFLELEEQLQLKTLPIFTLNYDAAVEWAARERNVALVDGIRRAAPADNCWLPEAFHRYAPGADLTVVLFKLHGSTTWAWDKSGSVVEVPPGVGKDPGALKHAILYPYLSQKSLDKEPFKTGYAYLAACLARAQRLAIIGTSLRDQHLVNIMQAALAANPSVDVLVLDPGLDTDRVASILGSGVAAVRTGFGPDSAPLLARFAGFGPEHKRPRGKAAA